MGATMMAAIIVIVIMSTKTMVIIIIIIAVVIIIIRNPNCHNFSLVSLWSVVFSLMFSVELFANNSND